MTEVECAMGCGRPIPVSFIGSPYVARKVDGWEIPRAQGGTNHVLLRNVSEQIAHAQCVRLVADGINPNQGAMFYMTLYAQIKNLGDVDWMVDALCHGTPSNWWFPDSNKPSAYAKARLICDKCSVQGECLDFALRNDEKWWGMYGGTTPAERRVMLGLKPRRQMDGLG